MPESAERAFARFERALALDPRNLEARLGAAAMLGAHDYCVDAIQMLLGGFKYAPRAARLRSALAAALHGFPLDEANEAVRGVLLDLC
ncbi:MAG: hypothetical protein ACRET8_11600, partial [Burkholderiales bacterium]